MDNPPIAEAFYVIAELAEARGVTSIGDLPGCWETEAGEFKIKVNGHREEIDDIPSYHALIEANGWPLGLISPAGGVLMASGREESTESLFIAACKQAADEARHTGG